MQLLLHCFSIGAVQAVQPHAVQAVQHAVQYAVQYAVQARHSRRASATHPRDGGP